MKKLSFSLSDIFSLGGVDVAVGLSIGSSSVKLVELKRSGKIWKLCHFGVVQLPEDALVNREIVNSIAVIESIKTLVNQVKPKTKNVCTSISGSSVMIKRMTIEVGNKKELQDQVFWEAEQYLPFDVNEVVMDYDLLSKSQENQYEVMVVAAKRIFLDAYTGCVSEAGLKCKIVDLDFFALQNTFEANYPVSSQEAVAIVDIGSSSLKFMVVHEGVPVYTKDAVLGGHNLTHEIQKHLNLSYADAESLKLSGNEMPQEVLDLMSIMAENFATEIKKGLDFYNASSSGAPVAYILLAGGSSKIRDISSTVEEVTGLPTQLMNPFNSISYDPKVFEQDYLLEISPLAAVPIGLALRAGGA
jgi:type IV pilus assembly protein PilM